MTDAQKAKLRQWSDQVDRTADDAVVVGGPTLALIQRMIAEVCGG